MHLSHQDKNFVMSKFPQIKLSYVKKAHKKVSSANIFLAIPKGKKHFAWFIHFKNKYICLFLEIDRKGHNIKSIEIKNCCFSKKLCSGTGTILYGTLFTHNGLQFFTVEDIYSYLGENFNDKSQQDKWSTIQTIFNSYINQNFLNNKDIIFGIPVMSKTRSDLETQLGNVIYPIYCIQHRYNKNNPCYYNEYNISRHIISANFIVKAEISDDIYTLYLLSKKTNERKEFNQAIIPNYKKSVFMNSIFRNIKENRNLDFLEESDDEEEFENIDADKYVDTNKEFIMECVYNRKFKLWEPMKINENGNVSFFGDIMRIEKNNRY